MLLQSSEREDVRLDAGIEELDLEQPVDDRAQLVEAHGAGAVAVLVDVKAVSRSRRPSIDANLDGMTWDTQTQIVPTDEGRVYTSGMGISI